MKENAVRFVVGFRPGAPVAERIEPLDGAAGVLQPLPVGAAHVRDGAVRG